MKLNRIKVPISGVDLKNGIVRLDVSLNDYPRLTVTRYGKNLKPDALGSIVVFQNLRFYCESSYLKTLPPSADISDDFADEVTSSYLHVARRVYEKPLRRRRKGNANAYKISRNFNFYNLDSFYNEASGEGNIYGASVEGLSASIIRLSKEEDTEDNESTTTLRALYEPRLKIRKQIWAFNQGKLYFKSLNAGSSSIRARDLVGDITTSISAVPTYRRTQLTWEEEPLPEKNSRSVKVVKLDDDRFYTYEGDWNPHIRPPVNLTPRDLSANADMGGTTKQFKIVNYRYGQPDTEVEGVFGFAHAALELVSDPERPNDLTDFFLSSIKGDASTSGNAIHEIANAIVAENLGYPSINLSNQMEWRLISVKFKKYRYQTVPIQFPTPYVRDENGFLTPVTVPQEYNSFLSNLQVEVLIGEDTEGWELRRFATEDAKDWTKGSIAAWNKLRAAKEITPALSGADQNIANWLIMSEKLNLEQYLWRRIPIIEKVNYYVGAFADYYKDAEKIQWDVQYIPRNQVSQFAGSSDTTEIPVLFPSVDWVPELMVLSRTRFTSSIATMGNPNFNPFAPNLYETNPTTVTSGSEEYEHISYAILPSQNTKPDINKLNDKRVNLNTLVSIANSQQELEGTRYKPHPFMQLNDYGLPGKEPVINNIEVQGTYNTDASSPIDRFISYVTVKSSQGEGIKNNKTTSSYQLSEGRPPTATIRKPNYKEEIDDKKLVPPYEDSKTFISSNIVNPGNEFIDSYNADGARNFVQAIRAAEFDLDLSQINASNSSVLVSFGKSLDFGSICGTSIDIGVPGMTNIVKGVSYEVQYADGDSYVQPIQVQIGSYTPTQCTGNSIRVNNNRYTEERPSQATGELELNIDLGNYGTQNMVFPKEYSRWV